MATNDEWEVRFHKHCYAKSTIKAGTRSEMEKAIEGKLRPDADLEWEDGPEGIDAEVIPPIGKGWKIRRRFFKDGED
jgi:hypothetical protein